MNNNAVSGQEKALINKQLNCMIVLVSLLVKQTITLEILKCTKHRQISLCIVLYLNETFKI